MITLKKLLSVLIFALPFGTNAQGYQVNLQGQVQQGMGGAGTAYIQDGAALFFNPGGACFLKGNSLNVGARVQLFRKVCSSIKTLLIKNLKQILR